MEDNVSKIKDKLDVVDVLSGYIKVQKAGINFKGRCPFHNEKTPSFFISPERQIWHCFGCQKGGDMFTFVQEMEGVEFGEALKILAAKAGVQLSTFDVKEKDTKSKLYDICETAGRFFEKQLHLSNTGKRALAYLKDRGLKDETIAEFRLGFAPNDWRSLSKFLSDCGCNRKDIIDSGLAIKKDNGDIYDRFRSRIVFPIFDTNERIVGFSGRMFEEGPKSKAQGSNSEEIVSAKYINTPQTAIYDKSKVLYGLNKARTDIRQKNRCTLVEGNIDVIMCYQAGTRNTVATSGTALTPSHLQLLQRYTNNLDFCFDTDQAGAVATRRGLGMALSRNFNIKIIQIDDPESKDPADYIKKFGQKWQELASSAKPVLDFYFDKVRRDFDVNSMDGKKAVIASLSPFVKRLTSQVERSHWISKIAVILKSNDAAVSADVENAKDDLSVYAVETKESEPLVKSIEPRESFSSDILEQALLAVILKRPGLAKEHGADLAEFVSEPTAKAITLLTSEKLEANDIKSLSRAMGGNLPMEMEFAHLRSQELLADFSDKDLEEELLGIKSRLQKQNWGAKLASLHSDIKIAESMSDKKKISELILEINKLTSKFSNNEESKKSEEKTGKKAKA